MSATVRIVSGAVDCSTAEGLFRSYYGEPEKLQGSGGFRTIGDWMCSTANVQTGGGSGCSTESGWQITAK